MENRRERFVILMTKSEKDRVKEFCRQQGEENASNVARRILFREVGLDPDYGEQPRPGQEAIVE